MKPGGPRQRSRPSPRAPVAASSPPTIVIAGAGIGGLTAALALHQRGIPCRVLEAAREIRPLGVGINLLPSATRVMAGLGLARAARRRRRRDGRAGVLQPPRPADLARAARAAPPATTTRRSRCHRGALQALLLDAVRERLGADASSMRARADRVSRARRRTSNSTLRDRATGTTCTLTAGVLVGADGIHSVVRTPHRTAWRRRPIRRAHALAGHDASRRRSSPGAR